MKIAQLFKLAIHEEESSEQEIQRKRSISELRLIKTPRCTSCNKIIHPRDSSTVAFICPNCGQGIIIRCTKCRITTRSAKCPVCGYEFP